MSQNLNSSVRGASTIGTVVRPIARGDGVCGEDTLDNQEDLNFQGMISKDEFFESFLRKNRHNENLKGITHKLELFIGDIVYQVKLLKDALLRNNLQTVDVVAKRIATHCDNVGATRMMQLSYQIHMAAHLGDGKRIETLLEVLERHFEQLKEKFVVAL